MDFTTHILSVLPDAQTSFDPSTCRPRPLSVSIDSRTIKKNDVFLALRGSRYDGHVFCAEAFSKGAFCAIVSDRRFFKKDNRYFLVNDTHEALKTLARCCRQKFQGRVIAITGSVGKTSTKDLLIHVLSSKYRVIGTLRNNNNEIGICLTLLSLQKKYDIAVVEVGINRRGEMEGLADMIRPDGVIMTGIHPVHLKGFGSLEQLCSEKMKLLRHTGVQNFFVYPHNENLIQNVSKDFLAERWQCSRQEALNMESWAPTGSGALKNNVPLVGVVARNLGLRDAVIRERVQTFVNPSGRFSLSSKKDFLFVDDTYNSSPQSCLENLKHFARVSQGRKKILCLGCMEELGESSLFWHMLVLRQALKLKPKLLFLVGDAFRKLQKRNSFLFSKNKNIVLNQTISDVIKKRPFFIEQGDAFYAKGSRRYGLERWIHWIRSMAESFPC